MPSFIPQTAPTRFMAAPFDADTPCEWLSSRNLPTQVSDETGFASGAMLYDVEVEPEATSTVVLDLPLHPRADLTKSPAGDAEKSIAEWREKLNRVELRLPKDAQPLYDT